MPGGRVRKGDKTASRQRWRRRFSHCVAYRQQTFGKTNFRRKAGQRRRRGSPHLALEKNNLLIICAFHRESGPGETALTAAARWRTPFATMAAEATARHATRTHRTRRRCLGRQPLRLFFSNTLITASQKPATARSRRGAGDRRRASQRDRGTALPGRMRRLRAGRRPVPGQAHRPCPPYGAFLLRVQRFGSLLP